MFFLFFRKHEEEGDGEGVMLKTRNSNYPLLLPILYLVAGLLLLGVGGKISEIAAVQGALLLGVSEMYIGVTIVALATSLPELVTTIIAVLKKQPGLAWGNIFGSNLFNILFVLPITMIVIRVPMFRGNEVDSYIHLTGNPPIVIEPFIYMISMLTITTITFWFMRNGTKNRKEISNKEGLCLITFYALFIVGITIWKSMR